MNDLEGSEQSLKKLSRREALSAVGKISIAAVIAGVAAGVGGYYAGSLARKGATVTKTVTSPTTGTKIATSTVTDKVKKHFEGIRIRFFCGGNPGNLFSDIVYRGARDAERDLGPSVEYVFSGWDPEKMVAQFRDAVAAAPDVICMMGHPGEAALEPLIDEAFSKGIIVTLQNVDLPNIRKKYAGKGMGYVGQVLYDAGVMLAEGAIERFKLKPGDRALVFGPWQQPGRLFREKGVADTLEKYGLVVERMIRKPEYATDPMTLLPVLSSYISAHPDLKLICYAGGEETGTVYKYMEAIGKKPGEIINIGFDLNPGVIEGFKRGYLQLTIDQQPYLQGYLPILQGCLTKKYKFTGLYINTGGALIDATNYKEIEELVEKGYR